MKNTSAVGQHKGNTCKNAKIVHKKKPTKLRNKLTTYQKTQIDTETQHAV